MKKELMSALALAAMLGAGVAHAEDAAKPEKEKCYGVAKAGKNDCAAKDGSSSCAGQAKTDRDANHWVYLPKGACDKIAGGMKS